MSSNLTISILSIGLLFCVSSKASRDTSGLVSGHVCLTTDGYKSPDKRKPCIFPFVYNNKTYDKNCATSYDGIFDLEFWCSTKTDTDHNHIIKNVSEFNPRGNFWGFCNENCPKPKSCSTSLRMKIAIASSCGEGTKCLDNNQFNHLNYVCMENFTESILQRCRPHKSGDKTQNCEAIDSHSINPVLQCYNFVGSEKYMLCLRRTDQDKAIFGRSIFKSLKSERINFFNIVDVADNVINCNGKGNYSLDKLYQSSFVHDFPPCEFNNKDVFSLSKHDFLYDYSFWNGKGRCYKNEKGKLCMSYATACNRFDCKCSYNDNFTCPNKKVTPADCNENEERFYCQKSKMCIKKDEICDGVFNCLHGEDEEFELCEHVFPEIATIKCIENRAEGINVTILAIPCDGIKECRDGSDEDCESNKIVQYASMMIFLFVTILIWCWIRYDVQKYSLQQSGKIENDNNETDYQFVKGDQLVELKESLSQKECAKKLKTEDIFSKLKDYYDKYLFNDCIGYLTYPLKIVTSELDFIKDILLVRNLNNLIGGFTFGKLHLFSANIVLLLVITIFVPQQLAAIRFASNLPQDLHLSKKIAFTLLLLIGAPLLMYYHKLELMHIDQKSKVNPKDETNNKKWEKKKRVMSSHVKLELGLETIYQLAGQFILLGLAYTDTATNESFPMLFKKENIVFLVGSIIYSFISCVNSHITAISACRERFPFKSKMIAAIYSLIGCTTRVLAMVMYFAVPLGLFNLLRHLQGEQYPWHHELVYHFVGPNAIGNISVGHEIIDWSKIDRWSKNHSEEAFIYQKYGGVDGWNPNFLISPPDYTLYTYFRLGQFFALFLTHVFLHIIIIYIAKYKLSKFFREKFNFIEKVIHCIENTNIPYNAQEWDDGNGNARRHRLRMAANLQEVRTVIAIKTVMNTILLMPLAYLVYKIQERNTFLWNTIGYLDKEYEALKTGYILLGVSVFWIIVGGFAEDFFFSLYNGKFHPFANILLDLEEIPLTDVKAERSYKKSEKTIENDSKEIDTNEEIKELEPMLEGGAKIGKKTKDQE